MFHDKLAQAVRSFRATDDPYQEDLFAHVEFSNDASPGSALATVAGQGNVIQKGTVQKPWELS